MASSYTGIAMPSHPRTIYLANPYGFSAQQKATLLPPIVEALESLGLEVWEPSV